VDYSILYVLFNVKNNLFCYFNRYINLHVNRTQFLSQEANIITKPRAIPSERHMIKSTFDTDLTFTAISNVIRQSVSKAARKAAINRSQITLTSDCNFEIKFSIPGNRD